MQEMDRQAEKAYKQINELITPEVIALFIEKQKDYTATFLLTGQKGVFSDINRKFWKLYRGVYQGKELTMEKSEEVCKDMIGHLFLMIYCLREGIEG
tara:strand:+ start:9591 stop:9881 length:291 start_codon:yes stop_codon:yes gene_type:complete